MSFDNPVPETRVLAIASHVVYGYVGNRMATLVLQSLGCEVAALNTVQFSNHTGYGQFRGTKTTGAEISALYEGLESAGLNNDFDVLLSGYLPGAEAVEAVGVIARDLRQKSIAKPGSFFWGKSPKHSPLPIPTTHCRQRLTSIRDATVLDPVMGDEGRLYVDPSVVPAYKSLLRDADLILPNQFEAETLSGQPITSLPTLVSALQTLHRTHHLPHIIITSVRFPTSTTSTTSTSIPPTLSIIGSTCTSTHHPRIFSVTVPNIACFFSGTGDMFAALTVARLREAVAAVPGLSDAKSWVSPDEVRATDLPLAKAVEKVMGSMQVILEKTRVERDRILAGYGGEGEVTREVKSRAAEVRLVRNLGDLTPRMEAIFKAVEVTSEGQVGA